MTVADTTNVPVSTKDTFTGRLSKRISARRPRASKFLLNQRNIYIFPSKAGFAFCLVLALMLLTAINYQNSLVYLVLFIFGAIFKISIWLCFFNLRGLSVSAHESDELFEGDELIYKVALSGKGNGTFGLEVFVDRDRDVKTVQVGTEESSVLSLGAGKAKRGKHYADRIGLCSYYPFGLIRAWAWLGLETSAIVYPKAVDPGLNLMGGDDEGKQGQEVKNDQLDLLRNYQKGDLASHVHWKKYASAGQLVVREGELINPEGHWLRWDDFSEHGTELILSYLCFLVLRNSDNQSVFGLDIPGLIIQPDIGPKHRKKCLHALAMFGQSHDT